MNVIGTNIAALRASDATVSASRMMQISQNRLSTGKRINSAADDAAGLAISATMTAQVRGMNQGIRNANDGISLLQTAGGALDEVNNMLQRMRELSVQALSGTYSSADAQNIYAEQNVLADQIYSVTHNAAFNGDLMFSGGSGPNASKVKVIQAGANTSDAITLNLPRMTEPDDTVSALAKIVDMGPPGGGMAGDSTTGVVPSLAEFDAAIAQVSQTRAYYGAAQNQLQSAVANLTSNATNLTDARSRIEDADFAAETTSLAKSQILSQASTAMLAQANQSQQGVLKLLQ